LDEARLRKVEQNGHQTEDAMPTSLPRPVRRRTIDPIILFAFALAIAIFVIEIADPAPMDTAAAELTNP
jgi:hypothetical protein